MLEKIPLYEFQEKALTWAKTKKRIALFLEMRLGKTRIAIAWCKHHNARSVLVVAPLTVLGAWVEELALLTEPAPLLLRFKLDKFRRARKGWCLIGYEALRTHPHVLDLEWDAVILDESTRIKNPKSQVTRIINGGVVQKKVGENLVRTKYEGCRAEFRAVLSGLPAPEGPLDFVEQFKFLYGGFCGFRNYWTFRDNLFQVLDPGGWEWHPVPGTRELVKRELADKSYILSRKNAGIGEHKVYETRVVQMAPKLRKAYVKAEKEFCLDYPTLSEPRLTNWPMVMNIWLGRMAGGFVDTDLVDPAKLDELFTLLEGELREEKVVVWCRFNAEIEAIEQRCRASMIPAAYIVGATPLPQRDMARKALGKGSVRVLVCQIKCARYGIDLSAADTAIYYSNSYSLEERAQSEDRIVHPAKKTPLLLVDLVTEDTVDEDVVKALRMKHMDSKFFLSALAANFRSRVEGRK